MGFITEKGVLTYKSQVETGTSKSGNTWQKQTIVVSRENVNAPYDKAQAIYQRVEVGCPVVVYQ